MHNKGHRNIYQTHDSKKKKPVTLSSYCPTFSLNLYIKKNQPQVVLAPS